jgi:hypothetical protein
LSQLHIQIAAYLGRDSFQSFLDLLLSKPTLLAQGPQCENTQNDPGQQDESQEDSYESVAWLNEDPLPCCTAHGDASRPSFFGLW